MLLLLAASIFVATPRISDAYCTHGAYDLDFGECRNRLCHTRNRQCNQMCHEVAMQCSSDASADADLGERPSSEDPENPLSMEETVADRGAPASTRTGALQQVTRKLKSHRDVAAAAAAYVAPGMLKAAVPSIMKATGTVIKGVGTVHSGLAAAVQAAAASPLAPVAAAAAVWWMLSE